MDPIPENLFGDRIQSSVFYSLDGNQALVPNSLWIIDITAPLLLLSKNKSESWTLIWNKIRFNLHYVEIYLDHDVLFKSLIFWELFALSFR